MTRTAKEAEQKARERAEIPGQENDEKNPRHESPRSHVSDADPASSLQSSSESEEEETHETTGLSRDWFLNVRAREDNLHPTEQDRRADACNELRRHLRDRPTAPPSWADANVPLQDVNQGIRLALFSCPFKGCRYSTDDRVDFLHHLSSQESPHYEIVQHACEDCFPGNATWRRRLACIEEAVRLTEIGGFPLTGKCINRRTMRNLTRNRYNDKEIKALVCFVCGEIHCTAAGPEHLVEQRGEFVMDPDTGKPKTERRSHIEYRSAKWFQQLNPASLLNNCSFELWDKRYVNNAYEEKKTERKRQKQNENLRPASVDAQGEGSVHGASNPERQQDANDLEEAASKPPDGEKPEDKRRQNVFVKTNRVPQAPGPGVDEAYLKSEWCLRLPMLEDPKKRSVELFGCTEDVTCSACPSTQQHEKELTEEPFCRTLCPHCKVPVCTECRVSLCNFNENSKVSSVPKALANDNFYGYVHKLLVQKAVTWLECTAASCVWSTILVYYIEQPYGHLMLESMEGPQARTAARGNLFSFTVPWEDVQEKCEEASKKFGLPLDEEVLAKLVNVHVVGGVKDLGEALKGATMRVDVVLKLIALNIQSGHYKHAEAEDDDDPDCSNDSKLQEVCKRAQKENPELPSKVISRMDRLYGRYGDKAFVPDRVKRAMQESFEQREGKAILKESLMHDKNATPAEPVKNLKSLEKELRPLSLVAERSSKAASTVHEEHASILARYQTLEIKTGSEMLKQFRPQYLGMAHPYTLPVAVGGCDIPGHPRWRRPTAQEVEERPVAIEDPFFSENNCQVGAAKVQIFDLARSLPRRIEGQFRRHWAFVPGLWNLYFRNQVNLGTSLGAVERGRKGTPQEDVQQDFVLAAANLMHKLEHGTYLTQHGKKRRIDGDMTKLRYAEGITLEERKVMNDTNFRTKQVSGTQEIRTGIGHVCTFASEVYGNGIFMTVSPGERHSHLAVRLSRYRGKDPFVTELPKDRADEAKWIGADVPSLEAKPTDEFEWEVPGYDLRRILHAQDPLAPAMAFWVHVRTVLATLLGIRMCPDCPHCAETDTPCQNEFGSSAELMGGCLANFVVCICFSKQRLAFLNPAFPSKMQTSYDRSSFVKLSSRKKLGFRKNGNPH